MAVQSKWYALLDEHRGSMRVGKVVLEFRLHSDGRISNMKMTDNGVGEILGLYCQSAILEPAPYLPWPDEMRRAIGANHREIRFTCTMQVLDWECGQLFGIAYAATVTKPSRWEK